MKEVTDVIRLDQLYASPKHLAELFDLGMTSTRALINEMRASKKWRNSVVSYDRMLRVNVKDFETYWKTKSFIQ